MGNLVRKILVLSFILVFQIKNTWNTNRRKTDKERSYLLHFLQIRHPTHSLQLIDDMLVHLQEKAYQANVLRLQTNQINAGHFKTSKWCNMIQEWQLKSKKVSNKQVKVVKILNSHIQISLSTLSHILFCIWR